MDSEAAQRDSWSSIDVGPSSGLVFSSSPSYERPRTVADSDDEREKEGPAAEAAVAPRVAATEIEQVHRAGRGDARAQTWLITRVLPRVRRIARTFLGASADADDAAQTALIAILRSAPTYRGEAAVEGWAGRIAVRATLKLAAERRRERPLSSTEMEFSEEEAAPESARSAEALPRDLRVYLDGLPEAQRTAVLLHHALDHSIDEIAATTEVSPDTVKSRLRLGLAALRKQIRQDIAIGRRRSS
ncbi:MAG: sigma-70 family RNA polymerase sigma factor [Polyangiaceae bacterium]